MRTISFFRLTLLSCLAACSLSSCGPRVHAPAHHISLGKPVEFDLPLVNGSSLSSSALEGRYVLLHLWATWCIPCVQELSALQSFAAQFPPEQLSVLIVAVESDWDAVDDYLRSRRISLPCLLDRSGNLKSAFRLLGVPSTFLLDKQSRLAAIPDPQDGILRSSVSGPRDWTSASAHEVYRRLLKAE